MPMTPARHAAAARVCRPSPPPNIVRALLDELCARPAAKYEARTWQRIADEAERRDASPLLHAALHSSGRVALVPPEVRRALEESYGLSALGSRQILNDLSDALRTLASAGIRVLLLKGAYLAEGVYGDAALRPMGDLDLLLREQDLERGVDALSALGYTQRAMRPSASDHHIPPLVHARRMPIELHRRIKEWHDPEGLWRRSRPVSVAGQPAFRLSATDLVLQLALHAGQHHQWQGAAHAPLPLRALLDVSLSISRFEHEIDWALLAAIASEHDVARHAYVALAVARSLVAARVPRAALDALPHDGETDRMVSVVEGLLTASTEESIPAAFGAWQESQGGTQRLRVVMRTLFPPVHRLREIYGLSPSNRLAPCYYMVRPFDLLWRRGSMLVRIVTGRGGGHALAKWEHRRGQVERFAARQ